MTLQSIADTDVQRTLEGVIAARPRGRMQDVEAGVVAVVTVGEDRRFLDATMRAVLAQRTLPGTVVVADCSGGTARAVHSDIDVVLPGAFGPGSAPAVATVDVQVVAVRSATSFGDAVAKALTAARLPSSAECLWLLHDDSRPAADDCLERLVEAHRNAPTASVIGVKQLDWEGVTLHDVGFYAASGHRVVSLVVDGEPDQEQYDGRQDVFAVGLAGALVTLETWRAMGGTTPWMTTFGESADFCRRVCLNGGRVLVVPQAAVAHRRARFEGIRTRADAPVDEENAGNPALSRITAAWRYRVTDVGMPSWPLQWLMLLLRGLVMFFVQLARKRPYEGACELAMPWRALVNLPRAASARRRVARLTNTSLSQLRVLVANRTQLKRWRERRAAFDSQRSVVLLGPLAKAHLRTRLRIRFAWAAGMTVIAAIAVAALQWGMLRPLMTGAALTSGVLPSTGASFAQLWQSATTPYAYGTGLGAAVPPDPFLLVLAMASLVTGGNAVAAMTLVYVLAVPLAALSFWALAGVFTRSNPVRTAGGLMWGALAFALGAVKAADLPMLVVMVFLPAAFAFTQRAVAMYLTEDPVLPVPSVQSAALASLCFIPVVDAEPQLLLPLLVAFLAFLVLVRRHRLMLLLIPVPAAFSLAPMLVNAVRHDGSGRWRQLFGTALTPSTAANGSPRAMTLADAVADGLGYDVSAAGWRGWFRVEGGLGTLMLLSVAVVAVVAAFALVVPRALRVSRMMWVAVVAGSALALVSPRVMIGLDAEGPVAGSVLPGLALAFMGLLASVCMVAGSAVHRFTPLNGPHAPSRTPSRDRAAHVGRMALTAGMAACIALWGWFGATRTVATAPASATRSGLPMVVTDYLAQDPAHRVLAVSAQSADDADFTVMRTARGELVDGAPALDVDEALHGADDATSRIAESVARLLSNGDAEAVQTLSDLGIGGIFVTAGPASDSAAGDSPYDALVSNITASQGTQNVVSNEGGTYFRLTIRDVASQGIDLGAENAATNDAWRWAWIWCMGAVTGLYCLVALPGRRMRGQEQA